MGIATPQLLTQIRDPESPFVRLAALRTLKNEIVGHDQRKEAWIQSGVIPVLSQVLANRREANGVSDSEAAKLRAHFSANYRTPDIRTGDDAACLQAAIVVGSLAQGGPAYTSPILAGDLVSCLLGVLSSTTCPQSLVVAILQALNVIADKIPSGYGLFDVQAKHLSSLLFPKDRIGWLCRILDQRSDAPNVQLSIDLAVDLIAKLCTEEQHKATLAEAGVLDMLAVRLATFVVAQGFVLPGAEACANAPEALGSIPPPAPAIANLASVLRAITVLVEHSKTRAEHFVTSPGMMTVFPKRIPHLQSTEIRKAPWATPSFSSYHGSRQKPSNPIDSLLPSVPVPPSQGSVNFPPLGAGSSQSKHSRLLNEPTPFFGASTNIEDESSLVSWLFHVARVDVGLTRVIAARLITTLFRLGLAKKQRVSMMAYLLIPLLLRMLDKDFEVPGDTDQNSKNSLSPTLRVREEAPAVLSSLVMDDPELQKNAADGYAIKKLAHLLKGTFNGGSGLERPMWWSSKEQPAGPDPGSAELSLGPHGFPPMVMHKMRVREGILKALAALSLFKEEYRKEICDNGLVPYIIDSMKPCDSETADGIPESKKEYLDLNPIPTLLAACYAAKSLTRSVSVLRTSLIDAGVATPIFTLAKFRDIDVQIAATQVICNLSMDFSPMKEAVIGANMIPTLCEHAHSSNTKLRIECLWALKHIAYNSSNDIKMKIIEQLEPGWIKQIITQDTASSSPTGKKNGNGIVRTPSVEMTTSVSTGECGGDLLPPPNGGPVQEPETEDPDQRMTEDPVPSNSSVDAYTSEHPRRRKLMLNGDLDHTKQARKDDIQVQEQTFDLLRNLICGTGASEMIDYLFREFGRNDLLEILAEKLRPRSLPPFGRRDSGPQKTVTAPSEILCSVTYILIHLAAGLSRHRQQLITHPELLRLMVPHFNHSNKQIRVNCVWVVINLTFQDDQSDEKTCFERALKLRSLGVMEKLSTLEDDSETDVRERTKTAMVSMNSLVGSGN